MESSKTLTLNEEALAQLADAKKPLFVFEWLRHLDKSLQSAQKVSFEAAFDLPTHSFPSFLHFLPERHQRVPKETGGPIGGADPELSRAADEEADRALSGDALQHRRHLPPLRHRQQVQRHPQEQG